MLVAALLLSAMFPSAIASTTPTALDRKLFDACGRGKLKVVLKLLKDGARADMAFEEGETALHVAGIQGVPGIAQALLAAGADPNARATGEHSLDFAPLHWWVYSSMPAESRASGISALLRAGADPSAVVYDEQGAQRTAVDIVESLLSAQEGDGGAGDGDADDGGRNSDLAQLRKAGGLSIAQVRSFERAKAQLEAARTK
tara:strand:- start:1310 stop:1912 length:603 start_codon:yes stop_codon:yes gene_type:complete